MAISENKLKIFPRGEDGYRTFSIRIKENTVLEIEKISSNTGRTRNELIGLLLKYALENCEIMDEKK